MDIVSAAHPLSDELAVLTQRERVVSHQRGLVHIESDRLARRAALDEDQFARLAELKQLDESLSLERRNLHERIAKLRAEMGLPAAGESVGLDGVA
jgi:hypothetical protein